MTGKRVTVTLLVVVLTMLYTIMTGNCVTVPLNITCNTVDVIYHHDGELCNRSIVTCNTVDVIYHHDGELCNRSIVTCNTVDVIYHHDGELCNRSIEHYM